MRHLIQMGWGEAYEGGNGQVYVNKCVPTNASESVLGANEPHHQQNVESH